MSEAALAMLDALAVQLIAAAAPLRFNLARTPAELDAVFRLRYRVVIERGWRRPEEFPDGRECDAFDADPEAVQIAGWDGAELLTTSRIVFPVPGRPLPTEEAFGLEIEPHGRVVDLSRTISALPERAARQRAFWGLMGRSWLGLRGRGFAHVCGVFSEPILKLYESVGFRVVLLAPARTYWGEKRYPIRMDMPASARTASAALGTAPTEA